MKKLVLIFSLLCAACSRTVPAPEIAVSEFPQIVGVNLEGRTVHLPQDVRGKNTIFLIGYRQKAQFDIDRWILGILQADINAQLIELPTIAGMMPEMIQTYINNGMRRGIPKEDWGSVVNIYEDAELLIKAFGNERPQSARVVALGKRGEILWTSDRGYSATQVLELKRVLSRKY